MCVCVEAGGGGMGFPQCHDKIGRFHMYIKINSNEADKLILN